MVSRWVSTNRQHAPYNQEHIWFVVDGFLVKRGIYDGAGIYHAACGPLGGVESRYPKSMVTHWQVVRSPAPPME